MLEVQANRVWDASTLWGPPSAFQGCDESGSDYFLPWKRLAGAENKKAHQSLSSSGLKGSKLLYRDPYRLAPANSGREGDCGACFDTSVFGVSPSSGMRMA